MPIAAGAVGRALGITIRPPAKSEHLNRTRASRLRMRRVLLSAYWWQKDCVPLLAYIGEDDQPGAIKYGSISVGAIAVPHPYFVHRTIAKTPG